MELVHASLLDALRWIGSERATGSIKVEGSSSGSLFFDSGRLYFGMVDGSPMSGLELSSAGIDRGLWQEASTRQGARLNFVEELLTVGCARPSIERFILNRLEMVIDRLGLHTGPVRVARGRHGFGAAISFAPDRIVELGDPDPMEHEPLDDDSLISLASVTPGSSVAVDGDTWNLLVGLFTPARYAEIARELGRESALKLTSALSSRSLLTVIESHGPSDPWAMPRQEVDERAPTAKPALFDRPDHRSPTDDAIAPDLGPSRTEYPAADEDNDEYVPDKVGRQAYAAMASMRASVAEPAPQDKARALRRLIDAVKGL
jgi:hypothetical protein